MMKKSTKNYGKKLITAFTLAAFILACSPLQSMANRKHSDVIVNAENTSSVQFAGSDSNELIFTVKIKNITGEKFTLVVHNEAGEIVFLKGYTDKSFNKQIKLMKNESSNVYYFSIWKISDNQDNKRLVEVINQINL